MKTLTIIEIEISCLYVVGVTALGSLCGIRLRKAYGDSQALSAGRLIVLHGRWWLDLSDETLERGARAVANSPAYRAELLRTALARAEELDRPALVEALHRADAVLDHAHPESTYARTGATK